MKNMWRIKKIEECEHIEGGQERKKSNKVDGSCWKLDKSILDRKKIHIEMGQCVTTKCRTTGRKKTSTWVSDAASTALQTCRFKLQG